MGKQREQEVFRKNVTRVIHYFAVKRPRKPKINKTELTHHQRAHVKNEIFNFCYESEGRKFFFIKSIDDKAYVRPGTSVGVRDVTKSGIYQPTDSNAARKLPKYDWVNQQVYTTPSTHRIFIKEPQQVVKGNLLVGFGT